MAKIEMIGKVYGYLKVIKDLPPYITPSGKSVRMVLCRCVCDKTVSVQAQHLRTGNTTSCGCKTSELRKNQKTKHGLSDSRLFNIWVGMKQRCYNEKSANYKNYGGRGIKVCNDWFNNFESFYDWSMANGYADDLTIDRIDVNGNYEPSNCRWADKETQENNKTSNVIIAYNGQTMNISQWAKKLNIPVGVLLNRRHLGWDDERIVTEPYHKGRKGIVRKKAVLQQIGE